MPGGTLDISVAAQRIRKAAYASKQAGDVEQEVTAVARDWLTAADGREGPPQVKEAVGELARKLSLMAADALEDNEPRHAEILERASDQAQAEAWRIN